MKKPGIAVLGAGSWGTAIAIHLARAGNPVLLWGREHEQIQAMVEHRTNQRYLPGIVFPSLLTATHDLQHALEAQHLLIALPSHAFKQSLHLISTKPTGIAWLTKGIDPNSYQLLSQVVADYWGEDLPMVAVSGPSFATEVAKQLPTALLLASNHTTHQNIWKNFLHHDNLRVYLTADMVGVQIAGAVKNILAIACGISDGLAYGANAKAALITRGLAEMSRLGTALGGTQETFMGLAGVGDLVLTCTDNQSRNRRFGLLIGQGCDLSSAAKQIRQVVEGQWNAAQICALSQTLHVDMPICREVNAVLEGQIHAKQAALNLMSRPPATSE